MSITCKLRGSSHGSVGQKAADIIDSLRAQLAASEQAARAAFDECEEQSARIETRDNLIQQLHADVSDLRAQLAAANKRLEEAERQEPAGEVQALNEHNDSWLSRLDVGTNLYTSPVPPADVAELQRDVDRLFNEANYFNRKLTEVISRHCDEIDRNVKLKGKLEIAGNRIAELERKLAQAREEGRKEAVPEGWQVVPKEAISEMFYPSDSLEEFMDAWPKIIAAAPSPASLNEAKCKSCGGNDADAPCAYPSEGKHGCLRDARASLNAKEGGE